MGSSAPRRPLRPIAAATLLLASTLMGAAAAQARAKDRDADPKADALARAHVRKAAEAFQAGRYDEALAEFEAGYAAVPRPGFILNMGHVARQAGNTARAREYYRRYLDLDPASPQRSEAEKALAELDALDAHRADPAGSKPPDRSKAARGEPRPRVVLSAVDDAEVPSGLTAVTREPVVRQADEGPAFYQRWWFWGAVAGVLAAGAVAFIVIGSRGEDYTTAGTWGTLGR